MLCFGIDVVHVIGEFTYFLTFISDLGCKVLGAGLSPTVCTYRIFKM